MIDQQVTVNGFGKLKDRTKTAWVVSITKVTVILQFGENNRGTDNGKLAFHRTGPMAGYNFGCGEDGWKITTTDLVRINQWAKKQAI